MRACLFKYPYTVCGRHRSMADEVDQLLEEIHGELQLELHTGDRPIPVPWSTIQDKRAFDRFQAIRGGQQPAAAPPMTTATIADSCPTQHALAARPHSHGNSAAPFVGAAADDDLFLRLERLKAPIGASSKEGRPSQSTVPTSSGMDELLAVLVATPPSAPLSHEQQVEQLLREAQSQALQSEAQSIDPEEHTTR